ncbi:MAG: ABC transporter transmembrane domain-containing protein [Aeromicrobium sp.]
MRTDRTVGLNRIVEPVATEPAPETATQTPPPPPSPAPAPPEKMSLRAEYKRAWKLISRHSGGRTPFVLAFVMLIIEAITAVLEPFPIAYTIDFIRGTSPSLRDSGFPAFMSSERVETVLLLGLAIIAIVAINKAADSMAEIFLARGGRAIGFNIRVSMYSRLHKLSLAFHDKRRTGDVITRLTGDVLVVEDFVVASLSNIVASFLLLVGSFAALMFKSPAVALVAAVLVPILALVSNFFSRRLKTMTKKQRAREGDLASTAQEMLSSIRLVQSYGRGNVDLDRFSRQSDQSMRAALKVATIQAQFSFVIALLEGLTITAVVWLGVWLVDRDAISIGTFVLLVLLIQNMFKPARKIVSEWYKVGKLLASADRINELLDREPAVVDTPGSYEAPELIGRLSFDNVCFSYHAETEQGLADGERPVLHNISFTAAPGEVVALVGVSGAGKSSIAQLVPRLYDPDDGVVLIDGFDIRQFTLASLRRQVSLVLQETLLLSGTVAENIAYGIDDATTDQVIQAAKQANAHDFIEELPDGYETVLGERGSTLSGGQRQRIAIARAFIRVSPVLVLDEPTTGLDPDSTSIVVDALKTLMHGSTTVVISHEMRLIQSADRILVLENGRIVQEGTHEDLARVNGPYADLLAHQVDLTVDGAPVDRGRAAPTTGPEGVTTARSSPPKWSLRAHLPSPLRDVPRSTRVRRTAEKWVADNLPGRTVGAVTTGKYLYGGDGGLTLRYAVELEASSPTPDVRTLLVRIAPDGSTLSVDEFPHDPDLPALSTMLDPSTALPVLRRSLSGIGGGLAGCTVEVVHHPRAGAAVLRYDLMPGLAGYSELQCPQVFAKVYARPADAAAAAAALRAVGTKPPRAENGLQVRLPRLLGEDSSVATNFLESLNAPAGPAARTAASMPITVREAATVLQVLHQHTPAQPVPDLRAADELRRLDSELAIVGSAWPTIAAHIEELVASTRRVLEEGPEGAIVLSHGDFTPTQMLRREDGIALIDLDSLCLAEAAFDAGRYLAYADEVATRSESGGPGKHGGLSVRAFLVAYSHGGMGSKEQFADRVLAYRSICLARMALRAARQLKDARLDRALALLETEEDTHGGSR